ncbi:MAG: hypothetical protein LBR06_05180 [Bacteroidales bacterium]|jgi:3-hydroxyacyl-[acyl-carrier-protein] dehydratase|nr:hypothetical protein [Bacteroidales bacterium]
MKLIDDFFTVADCRVDDSGSLYTMNVNAAHPIFSVHFPGNPITPGVCIVQLIKELWEQQSRTQAFLKRINNVKFLAVINPLETPTVRVKLSIPQSVDGGHKISATLDCGDRQFAKLTVTFTDRQ